MDADEKFSVTNYAYDELTPPKVRLDHHSPPESVSNLTPFSLHKDNNGHTMRAGFSSPPVRNISPFPGDGFEDETTAIDQDSDSDCNWVGYVLVYGGIAIVIYVIVMVSIIVCKFKSM